MSKPSKIGLPRPISPCNQFLFIKELTLYALRKPNALTLKELQTLLEQCRSNETACIDKPRKE